ncbi:GNAT family N-acetyltransferase [Herbiconiux liangxiaofengii]|uniref:GNAT family N-acetyltransferase n=1 Tax=Herbiconiux liangxiaofengii TaxID=3342795 RepID=UPI0035B6DA77
MPIRLRLTTTDDPVFRVLASEQVREVMRRYSSDDPGPDVPGGLPAYVAEDVGPDEERAHDRVHDSEHDRVHGAEDPAPPTPLGCVALSPLGQSEHPSETGAAEIKRMYVRETARGRGVARRLLAAVENLAAERGTRILKLEVGQRQPEAVALYTSAGWQRIDCYGYWKDEPLVICLQKVLTATPAVDRAAGVA